MPRPVLAAALLALLPAAARAQADAPPDARVAARPAAPATVVAAPRADAAPARPNESVVVRRAPSYRRDALRGALVGTGVGLAVGVLAYRNNERKCEGCVGNDAIPVIVTGVGTVLGVVAGSAAYLLRRDAGG
jgi:hypothetical protein